MMNIKTKNHKTPIYILLSTSILFISVDVIFRSIITSYSNGSLCITDLNCSGVNSILNFVGYGAIGNSISLLMVALISISAMIVLGVYSKILRKDMVLISVISAMLMIFSIINQKLMIMPTFASNQNSYILSVIILLAMVSLLANFIFQNRGTAISRKPFNIYSLWAFSTILVFGIGLVVSLSGSGQYCTIFPLCGNLADLNPGGYIALTHRLMVALLFVFTLIVLNHTWYYYRPSAFMLNSTTIAFTMLLGQSVIGVFQVNRDFPVELVILHAISAVVFLACVVLAYVASLYESPSKQAQRMTIFNDKQRRKDFYLLNKPIIVVLLLVTTYAGMVVAGGQFPPLKLSLWVIIAGALAAGGSSAINQYIDREIDLSMQRTAKRPIPSGRLMPAEGLALGIAEIVLSFYIYATFVNLLSGVLAMAGMVYYVFIYSLWLKHATVQNIVIGGGAGAIPPLVGWAAVTGSLNVPSLFLFAIVFLWTPPHFWALALVRKNDYARAKVPMMPVINGEKKTRVQIFIYTIELVILTLIMPVFHFGGTIYLISAALLGIWILYSAWRVLTVEGNKVAYKMYRYSSMYLAFIFLALTIDALL